MSYAFKVFQALKSGKLNINVLRVQVRHGHAIIKHGRAMPKMTQSTKSGLRHGRATIEQGRATLFSHNCLIGGTTMPKSSMAVPHDAYTPANFVFHIEDNA